ncbi:hypothetical protein WJX74_001017 [Apatococcus lobatus]|uniref:Uncharacterized protein n=1 Tax=Apatococcus lobatus TaxID=904363 RepID=A0AAW1RF40_9CHLO
MTKQIALRKQLLQGRVSSTASSLESCVSTYAPPLSFELAPLRVSERFELDMQLKSVLLLCGCAWLAAGPILPVASEPHHHIGQHPAVAEAHSAEHRRTDLKEVPDGGSAAVAQHEGPGTEGSGEPSLPESSFHCWHEGTAEEENKFTELGPHSQHTTCSYHNLYLWNGQVHYLSGNRFYVPRVRMAYEAVAWQETLDVKIVAPNKLPAQWPSRPDEEWPTAAFWYPSHFSAFDQLFGEHGPNLHILICSVLGLCDHSEAEQNMLRILFTNTHDATRVWDWPSQINEMWACFSKHKPLVLHELRDTSKQAAAKRMRHRANVRNRLLASVEEDVEDIEEAGEATEQEVEREVESASSLWEPEPDLEDRLILIKHAAVGVGPECRSRAFCQPEFGAERPQQDLMLSWKKRISSCFDVPESAAVKASNPLIGIVDYPTHTPRSLANAEGIVQHLQARLAGRDVRVERFVIGSATSMHKIGSIYSSVDLLIQAAGDRAANLVFLPKGAAVVDIATRTYSEASTWTIRMVRDLPFLWLGYVPVLDQRHKLLSITENGPNFQQLTPDQRTGVQLSQCPLAEMQLQCHEMWWFGSQVEVVQPLLEEAVSTGLTMIGQAAL